jgi:hypothetical protein
MVQLYLSVLARLVSASLFTDGSLSLTETPDGVYVYTFASPDDAAQWARRLRTCVSDEVRHEADRQGRRVWDPLPPAGTLPRHLL